MWLVLPAHFSAMRGAQYKYRHFAPAQFIDYPEVALAYAPQAVKLAFQPTPGRWILRKAVDPIDDTASRESVELPYRFESATLDLNRVTQTAPPPN